MRRSERVGEEEEPSGGWSEDALTARFRELAGDVSPEVALGIGDDASVLRPPPGRDLVWTVDALEEDVDFRRTWLTLEEVGARAVAVTLSDLAAMGARPLAVLLSLGSAAAAPAPELLGLFRGAARTASGLGARVAGGDVTRRARGIGIVVTALGTVPAGDALTRGGARPGDELWVTGTLGGAARGLALLERLGREGAELADPQAVSRWLRPEPRLAEGEWLRDRVSPRAAIDLSDGFARDLERLCVASRVGARLESSSLTALAGARSQEDLDRALTGGEDFELVISAPPNAVGSLAAEFFSTFGLAITRVGEVAVGTGLALTGGPGGERPLAPGGWDHVRGPLGGPAG